MGTVLVADSTLAVVLEEDRRAPAGSRLAGGSRRTAAAVVGYRSNPVGREDRPDLRKSPAPSLEQLAEGRRGILVVDRSARRTFVDPS